MRTFYDTRMLAFSKAKEYPLQGNVILKSKHYWLIKIYHEDTLITQQSDLKGYVVAPRTIYLYDCYKATGLWDGIKVFLERSFPKLKKRLSKKNDQKAINDLIDNL